MRLKAVGLALGAALTAMACGDDDGADPGGAVDAAGDAPDGGASSADTGAGGPGWQALDDLPTGPVQETAVVALDGRLYVIGGIDGGLATRAEVLVYDVSSGQWDRAADAAPSLPIPIHHANASVVDGAIYITGALLADFDPIGNVWSWRPGDPEWAEGTIMPLGSERGAAAVGVVDGLIVVAGGLGVPTGSSVDTVSTYDPVSGEWDDAPPELPARLDHGTGQTVDGVLYVIGGRTDGTDGNSAAVFAYVEGAWQERAPMPTARGGIAAGVLDGKIAVVGGEGNDDAASGVFAQAELYDPAADQWSALPDMRTPRHGMGAASVDGALYVPGGADREAFGAVATHELLRIR
ncbi:MAG TPA: hypothetical protein VK698_19215 [Kofleriaceae bacterium]|nr:hypothetical protein [Kofleriaceae bacterium]